MIEEDKRPFPPKFSKCGSFMDNSYTSRMNKNSFLLVFSVLLWLTACTAATPTPEPTQVTVADVVEVTKTAVSPTITSTPIPTASQTPPPTSIPTAEPSPTPQQTNTPEPPTPIVPTLIPTIDVNEEIKWTDDVQVIHEFIGTQISWSPSDEEFVYAVESEDYLAQIIYVEMTDFQSINITPTDFLRNPQIFWHPSGAYFFLTGGWIEDGGLSNWKIISTDMSATELDGSGYYTHWLGDELFVLQVHIGPGWTAINIVNAETSEVLGSTSFDGSVKGTSQNYVMLTQERGNSYNTSAAILAQTVINPAYEESEYGTHFKFLLSDIDEKSRQQPFNRFVDILPDTDDVLVITWINEVNHYLDLMSGLVSANLQLWDTESDTITMVIPDVIYGHYSPDGHYLAYLTPEEDSLQLHLLDQMTGENLFSQTAFAKADYYNAGVDAYTTFSPNGRFLTFFNPDHNLIIYDLENSVFLPPLTAVPITPVWSPDSSHLVYQDAKAGLSIFDTRTETAYPLAVTGATRLSEPQWSYDGTYLSVTVLQEKRSENETAVLQIP